MSNVLKTGEYLKPLDKKIDHHYDGLLKLSYPLVQEEIINFFLSFRS